MTRVNETEIDGVRTFWVDSGRPTLGATLTFRMGIADEDMSSSGWLHLLEHMALHGFGRGDLAVNGHVDLLHTMFVLHGPTDQVVDALTAISERLGRPHLDELDRERRVLAAEADTRQGSFPRALGQRYGARGPGLAAYGDPALGRATPDLLEALARRAFASGNGALALDGPPPSGMRLHLPEGGAVGREPRSPIQVEETPAVYVEPGGLVLSGVVPRSPAHILLPHVVEDAVRRKFRDQDGTSYSPFSTYSPVDAGWAVVLVGADVSPATRATLAGDVLDITDDLADQGPEQKSLDDIKAAARQTLSDPYNVGLLAQRAAGESLWGRPLQQLDELLADHDAVTTADLQPALAAMRESLLVGVPPETAPHDRLRVVQQEVFHRPAGGTRSTSWPADEFRLSVTERAVSLGDRWEHRRYPLDQIAGYYTWGNGARRIVLADGWSLAVLPGAWRRGDAHRHRLDGLVPPHLHLPQPEETAPAEVVAERFARRWWWGTVNTARSAGWGIALLVALMLGMVVWRASLLVAAVRAPGVDPGGHVLATLVTLGFLAGTIKLATDVRRDV